MSSVFIPVRGTYFSVDKRRRALYNIYNYRHTEEEAFTVGQVIFVTAFKGGVGKTFVSASVAGALTALGKKVLAIDGDFGMRSLDMLLGCDSSALFDASDVISGVCRVGDALIRAECPGRPDFMPAPQIYDGAEIDRSRTSELLAYLKSVYDFVIIDSSAEYSGYYSALAGCADRALIVTSHSSASVRAAGKAAATLAASGLTDQRLVINMYRRDMAKKGAFPTAEEIISASSVRLIGIIPYDVHAAADGERGRIAFSGEGSRIRPYEAAAVNIAYRLCGNEVPLFKGVFRTMRKKAYLT